MPPYVTETGPRDLEPEGRPLGTQPTSVAVDRLLEAIARLDAQPDGIRMLCTFCLVSATAAAADDTPELAELWTALLEVTKSVAEDLVLAEELR